MKEKEIKEEGDMEKNKDLELMEQNKKRKIDSRNMSNIKKEKEVKKSKDEGDKEKYEDLELMEQKKKRKIDLN